MTAPRHKMAAELNPADQQFSPERIAQLEADFWEQAARKGLPRFRWFRRPLSPEQLDQRFLGSLLEEDWGRLRSQMQPGDQIWPFHFHVRSYLGMRQGFLVLRNGRPLGGIVTIVS